VDLEKTGLATALRTNFPSFGKVFRYLPIAAIKDAFESGARSQGYAEQSLRRHQTLIENDDKNTKGTLLSKMYKAYGEESLTQSELVDNAMAYIIAGSDTTANTLTYLVWAVCSNSNIKERLVKELKTLPTNYTDADLKLLPYLRLVIEETLRLYPAAPSALPRLVPAGGAAFGEYWLPEGTVASTQAYSLHRNATVFPHPEHFNPLRWENPTPAMRDSFMPFGGGSRGTEEPPFSNGHVQY
jgi:cytochrome P450